jgi:hypothetical protein
MGKVVAAVLAIFLSTGFSVLPLVHEFRWLSGHWQHAGKDARWAEEYWSEPRADMMLGSGFTGQGLEVRSWEFMRIQGGTFWASPKGQPPVAFKIVEMGLNHVTFENPKHDYPTRISYRLEGKTLIATTSGPAGANPQTVRYRRGRK